MNRVALWSGGALLVGLAACGGDTGSDTQVDLAADFPDFSSFCGDVAPQVEAFLAEREAAWTPPADRAERYGGTFVAAVPADLFGGFNAVGSIGAVANEHQNSVVLTTLVRYDEEIVPQPYLAEDWELSEDRLELTFRLRQDVYWVDGVQTTAHDVAFTFEAATNPESNFANPSFWELYEKGAAGVEVVDSFTVRFSMLQPVPEVMDTWTTVAILPRHLLEDVPVAALGVHPFATECPVGNGPFVVSEHRIDDRWIFRANAAFSPTLGGRPYLDQYALRVIEDPTTRVAELLAGGVHYVPTLPVSQAETVLRSDEVELDQFPDRKYDYVAWNTRRSPFDDRRVRQAVALAFDSQEVIDRVLEGYGGAAFSSLFPVHWAFEPDATGLPFDRAGAESLLEDAGWVDRDGDEVRENDEGEALAFTLSYNTESEARGRIALILQSQLESIGFDVTLESSDWTTLGDRVTNAENRDFDAFILGWSSEFKHNDRDLFHSERINGDYAFPGLQSPRIDALIDSLTAEIDSLQSRALFSRYFTALVEEQPYLFLYFPDGLNAVRTEVRGYSADARGSFFSIADWWLAEGDRRSP